MADPYRSIEPDLPAAVALAELLRNWKLGKLDRDGVRADEQQVAAFIVRTLKGGTDEAEPIHVRPA